MFSERGDDKEEVERSEGEEEIEFKIENVEDNFSSSTHSEFK